MHLVRKQTYLTEELETLLSEASQRRDVSQAELVRKLGRLAWWRRKSPQARWTSSSA
ncbi:MAG: hypothetical protein M0Z54_11535 [Thermaerobacter sp.]|nr:hypothetical protein [Thermaerobacter sp.]